MTTKERRKREWLPQMKGGKRREKFTESVRLTPKLCFLQSLFNSSKTVFDHFYFMLFSNTEENFELPTPSLHY